MNAALFSKIDEVYNNPLSTGYIGSIKKLHNAVRKIDSTVKLSDIKSFLKSKDSYTLHLQQPNKFQRRPFIVSGSGKTIAADVGYLKNLSQWNDGTNFLLFIIDVFSKYLVCYSLKSLKSIEISCAFESFFEESIFDYKKLCVDNGVEFYSRSMSKLLIKYKVHRYSTFNRDIKVAVAERVIRTIKTKIFKFLTLNNTNRYIDSLQDIVLQYNISKHCGILGNIPINIHLCTSQSFFNNLNQQLYKKRGSVVKSFSSLLTVGENVRLKSTLSTQHKFKKAYAIRNTTEIFKITSVNTNHNPVTYFISDLNDTPISGCFYRQELVPVTLKDNYKIEILQTRKRKGREEIKVRYIDYPNEKTQWIDKSNLEQCRD